MSKYARKIIFMASALQIVAVVMFVTIIMVQAVDAGAATG
jgi:hypothetical protein